MEAEVVSLSSRVKPEQAPPLVVPLDSVERARSAMTQILSAMTLGLAILDREGANGAAAVLHSVAQVLDVLPGLIT